MINCPFTTSVFLRISPYMVTEKYARNTEPCNTEKYGRIRSVYTMYTTVYGIVYGRIRSVYTMYTTVYGIVYGRKRSYTESVYVDLGSDKIQLEIDELEKCLHRQHERAMIRLITYQFTKRIISNIINIDNNDHCRRILLPYLKQTDSKWSYFNGIQSSNTVPDKSIPPLRSQPLEELCT
jgi:hypothetical protein